MIKPKSVWWNHAQVINWVFTRNLRLTNLMVDQQWPKTKRYTFDDLRLALEQFRLAEDVGRSLTGDCGA